MIVMKKAVPLIGTGGMGLVLGASLAIMGGGSDEPDKTHHSSARSTHWHTVRAAHLIHHPCCEVCGAKKNLEVHHIKPFHENPELELDPSNLITLCENRDCKSHITLGHLGNYKLSNPHVREDAALMKKRREDARDAKHLTWRMAP
jgi:hypothetical protein